MTIASELITLANTKAAIKAAIEAKGQDLTGINFAGYAPKIGDISTGATPLEPPLYVRPSDWLTLPDVTGQQKFVGLHAVYPDSNFCALLATGAYTVDWGDGTIENIASGVQALHQYDYSTFDVANTTLCSRGYKQAIITVTPQAGQNLTTLNLHQKHTMAGLQMYSSNFLDIAISGSLLTSLLIGVQTAGVSTQVIRFANLERITLLDNAVTNFSYMLIDCYSLQNILLFNVSVGTNFSYLFQNCRSLHSIPLLSVSAGTNFTGMFQGCSALLSVPLLDTSMGTSFNNMFTACYSLQTIPLLNTGAGANFSYMFNSCYSLQTVPLLNTGAGTDFSYMFNACHRINSIPLLNTIKGTNFSNMFSYCYSLQTVPLLNTGAGTNFNNMFYYCYNLKTAPLLNTINGMNFNGMFNLCTTLQSIPFLNTSNGSDFSYMFQNCYLVETIPLLDTSKGTLFAYMFSGCVSLQTIPLLDTGAGTNFSYMFNNCYSLSTIPLLNVSSASDLGNMFSGCSSLSKATMQNIYQFVSFVNCKLSSTELNSIYTNLKTNGTGSVSFQITANTVTKANHGIAVDTPVSFSGITSTTNITNFTTYYVINPTTDTFQLSTTRGGSVRPLLSSNGFGTFVQKTITVTGNWGVASDTPSIATAKGWAVTG